MPRPFGPRGGCIITFYLEHPNGLGQDGAKAGGRKTVGPVLLYQVMLPYLLFFLSLTIVAEQRLVFKAIPAILVWKEPSVVNTQFTAAHEAK